jgi:hypothetical protein
MDDVKDRLLRALDRTELVYVHRKIRKADVVDGYVLAVGAKWVLMATLGIGSLNGFTAVKLKDIVRVKRGRTAKFWRRLLELQGEWPPAVPEPEVALDGIHGLLESAPLPLVTIHIEREDPEVCFIGVRVKVTRRWLRLAEVTPKAKWSEFTKWELDSITKVDFGGGYERALFAVAGPHPRI